jgi:DNA-binding NtrC family response regulator
MLMAYSWPGNIRELQNVILAAAVEAPLTVERRHLQSHMKGDVAVTEETMTSMEDRIIQTIKNSDQKTTLAQLHADLHVPKPTLHRYLVRMADNGTVNRVAKGRTVWFTTSRNQHSLPDSQLSGRQLQAIRFATENGGISRKQLSDAIGVSITRCSSF